MIARDWPKQGPYYTPWVKWSDLIEEDEALVVIKGQNIIIRRNSPMQKVLENLVLHKNINENLSAFLKTAIRQEVLTNIGSLLKNISPSEFLTGKTTH